MYYNILSNDKHLCTNGKRFGKGLVLEAEKYCAKKNHNEKERKVGRERESWLRQRKRRVRKGRESGGE